MIHANNQHSITTYNPPVFARAHLSRLFTLQLLLSPKTQPSAHSASLNMKLSITAIYALVATLLVVGTVVDAAATGPSTLAKRAENPDEYVDDHSHCFNPVESAAKDLTDDQCQQEADDRCPSGLAKRRDNFMPPSDAGSSGKGGGVKFSNWCCCQIKKSELKFPPPGPMS